MRHGVETRGKATVWQEDFGRALQSKSLDGEAGQFSIMRGTGPDATVSWVKADSHEARGELALERNMLSLRNDAV